MEKERFIVYGAGRVGREISDLLLRLNKQIVAIWDRNPKRKGMYREIPIVNPYENTQIFQGRTERIIVALASSLENEKIYNYLREAGCEHVYQYSEARGGIVEELCSEDKRIEENCVVCAYAEKCNIFIRNNLKKIYGNHVIDKQNIIDEIFVAVTNRCTLNCKYCAQCTDEIKKQGMFYDMTLTNMKIYIKRILAEVSYIHHLTLTGGEALLCRGLAEILRFLYEVPQIGYIRLITTGAVEISDPLIEILKNSKLIVWLDDYGKNKNISLTLQENLQKNLDKLSRNDIQHIIIDNSNGTWYDVSDIERNMDLDENIKKNKDCILRKCLFLSVKGNLSWCSRNISYQEYGLIPDDKRDYCNLGDEKDSLRIKEILNLEYLHGCEYCNGTNTYNVVDAGMQLL